MADTAEDKAAAKAAKEAEKAAAKAAKEAEKAAAKAAKDSASGEAPKGFQVLDGNGRKYRVVADETEAKDLAKAIQGRVA